MHTAYANPSEMAEQNQTVSWIWSLLLLGGFISTMGYNFFPAGVEDTMEYTGSTFGQFRSVAMLGLGGLGALAFLRRQYVASIQSPLAIFLLVFVTYTAGSFLWADDLMPTVRRVITFSMLGMCTFGFASLYSMRDLQRMVIITGLVTVCMAIAVEIKGGIFLASRFGAMLGANSQGIMLGVLVLATLAYAHERWPAMMKWALVGGLMILLFLTGSRGALMLTLVGILIWRLLSEQRPLKLAAQVICIACLAIPVAFVVLDDFGDTLAAMVTMGREDAGASDPTSLTGRLPLWQFLINHYVTERPLLGFGLGGFWNDSHIYVVSSTQDWRIVFAHSALVDLALDLGIIGLSLFLIVLLGSIIRSARLALAGHIHFAFAAAVLTMITVNSLVETVLLMTTIPSLVGMILIVKVTYFDPEPVELPASE